MNLDNLDRNTLMNLLHLEVQKFLILAKIKIYEDGRKKKRFAVRKILRERRVKGYYANLIPKMRLSEDETFKNFHRMDKKAFDDLLACMGPYFRLAPNRIEEEITPGERLALTLRYLASGDSMKSIGFYGFRIGASTTSNIIRETCQLIWEKLQFVFPTPSEEAWINIAKDFYDKWGFLNCLGAIDGKHVVVQAFANHNSLTYNYKHSHSLLLMAIADAHFKFIMVDIGALGHNSDGGVFNTSTFGRKIIHHPEELKIPNAKVLSTTNEIAPFVFVADKAFPLRKSIMRPYSGRNVLNLPANEERFNSQLSRARRVVEISFGILANRFRIYRRPIIASKETVINIVKATVCLHNWLRDRSINENSAESNFAGDNNEEIAMQNLLEMSGTRHNHASADAVNIRKTYTAYFNEIQHQTN